MMHHIKDIAFSHRLDEEDFVQFAIDHPRHVWIVGEELVTNSFGANDLIEEYKAFLANKEYLDARPVTIIMEELREVSDELARLCRKHCGYDGWGEEGHVVCYRMFSLTKELTRSAKHYEPFDEGDML